MCVIDARQQFDSLLTRLVIQDVDLQPAETIEHPSENPHDRGGHIYSELCKIIERHAANLATPPVVATFGDVTTTVMCAASASRVGGRLVHIEAGVRSAASDVSGESVENRIRRMTAQASMLNLCVLPRHVNNLQDEKVPGISAWVGDLGRDYLLARAPRLGSRPGSYVLVHIHKVENTGPDSIRDILAALNSTRLPATFIAHPSVQRRLAEELQFSDSHLMTVIAPMGYGEVLSRICESRLVLTDSGSVQREAFHLGKRCVVRRDTVGWSELLQPGGHVQVGRSQGDIAAAIQAVWDSPHWSGDVHPDLYKEGGVQEAADLIDTALTS
jgi:UDP-N-acetylglucosamine 2-epimerase